jgi:hypothetical protein
MITDYKGIKEAVSEISVVENGQLLPYRGRDYWIGISSQGPIAEAFDNSYYSGADIYIWDQVPEKFRRAIILHEVIEADLYFFQDIPKPKSHKKAVELDRRFARETLDSKTLAEYEEFRKQGGDFFS